MKRSYEMDLCSGPLLSKILLFSLPLILSGVLQLLFNATDIVVVGKFAGSNAMAAVGSTTSLFNLLVNSFIGISVGANVLVARHYGERDYDGVQQTIQTALLTGFMAKESVVSTLTVLVGGVAALQEVFTPFTAFVFLVFTLLYTPCVAAIATVKKETNGRTAAKLVVSQCVVAWVVAFCIRAVGLAFGLV